MATQHPDHPGVFKADTWGRAYPTWRCHVSFQPTIIDMIAYSTHLYGKKCAYEFAVRTRAIAQHSLFSMGRSTSENPEEWYQALKDLKRTHMHIRKDEDRKVEAVKEIDYFLNDYAAAFGVDAITMDDYREYLQRYPVKRPSKHR